MIKIVSRDGTVFEIAPKAGSTVLDLSRDAGVYDLEAICGGNCSCATCHVYIEPSPPEFPAVSPDEDELLNFSPHRTAASRLACQLVLTSDDMEFTVTCAPED
jgi:2Fe-2S ferredoxin